MSAHPTSTGLRVALVTNTPAPYRVPALRLLAAKPGINLQVAYCAAPHIDTTLNAAAHGFEPHFLSARYRAYERRFMHSDWGVVRLLRCWRPDVLITTGYIPTFLYAFAWSRAAGVAHIPLTDGTLDSERSLSRAHRWVRQAVFQGSAAFVGASEGSLALFRDYGVADNRLFKAPLAIDNHRFSNVAGNQQSRDIDLLFCGRLIAHKRPDFALQVAAGCAERLGRPVSIDFLGSGPLEDELRLQARSMQQVRARFLGYASQQDLPHHYARAKVFLFPSEWDPWGVVANEACAAGMPLIATPYAGVSGELLRDGENGWVRPLVLDEWVVAAANLLADPDLRQRMAERSQDLVRKYHFDAAADGLHAAVLHATQGLKP